MRVSYLEVELVATEVKTYTTPILVTRIYPYLFRILKISWIYLWTNLNFLNLKNEHFDTSKAVLIDHLFASIPFQNIVTETNAESIFIFELTPC